MVAGIVLSVVLLAACGAKDQAAHVRVSSSPSAPAALSSKVAYSTASDAEVFGEPVADPTSGIWYMTGTVNLDHLNSSAALTSISLPREFYAGRESWDPTFAVDPDGTAWALGASDLAEVTAGAQTAKLIPLGPLPDNGTAESYRPSDLRGVHSPQVLASDGGGHIAVALSATSVVRVYSRANGTFSDLDLPTGTDAWSLRYFGNGSLAIGLENYLHHDSTYAVIASTDGSLSQPIDVGDSLVLHPYSATAVLFGGMVPTILNSDGTTQTITLPAGLEPSPILGGVQLGRNGKLVVTTSTGITILAGAADSTVTATYSYPTTSCGPNSGGGPTGPTDPGAPSPIVNAGPCNEMPQTVTVGADGTVWILNTAQVALKPHLAVGQIASY